MEPPTHVDSDAAQPSKRKRVKGPLACEACRRRRSRCDAIDYLGCHRCKQLQTDCSFKAEAGAPYHTPGPSQFQHPTTPNASGTLAPPTTPYPQNYNRLYPPQPQVPEYQYPAQRFSPQIPRASTSFIEPLPPSPTYAALQARISQLEQSLASATAGPSTQRLPDPPQSALDETYHSPVSQHHPPSALRKEAAMQTRDEAWFLGKADPESFGLMHRGMMGKEEQGLKDPVQEGILTERQAEVAFQIFKHHIIEVFPHSSFLNIRSRLPTHPFLRSACLIYVSRCVPDMDFFPPTTIALLEQCVADNLTAYLRGCRASLEGIMAAYILSLMPHEVTGKVWSDWDPARMIGQAYGQTREMGHSLSSDRLMDTLASGTPLYLLQETLDAARLFMCTMARIVWFAIVRCPQSTAPAGLDPSQRRLLSVLKDSHTDCDLDRHTLIEHSCLEILVNHSRGWHHLERIKAPLATDLKQGNDLVVSAMQQFDALRLTTATDQNLVSMPYLHCHMTYCKWWVATRNVWWAFRLPLPLFVEVTYCALLDAMEVVAHASRDVLVLCLQESWNLSSMPKAIGTAVVLCYLTISTGIVHLQHLHPTHPLPECLNIPDTLRIIETKLASSGKTLAGMLARTKENVDEYRLQLEEQDREMENRPPAEIVPDLLSGFEGWWDWQVPLMDDGTGMMGGGAGMMFGMSGGGFP